MSCFLDVGSKGEKVNQLEAKLRDLGYYKGKVGDSYYGPVLRDAVRHYQGDHGLQKDCVGPITWNSLFSAAPTPVPVPPTKVDTIYLQPSKNCQSNNPSIIQKARELGSGENIFKWVRDAKDYDFYYNTRYGAIGMLNMLKGNCTDMAHLIVALCRAAGIPARYWHVKAQFKSGIYGHTVAEIYINNRWVVADATNNANVLGHMVWSLVADYGHMAELPY